MSSLIYSVMWFTFFVYTLFLPNPSCWSIFYHVIAFVFNNIKAHVVFPTHPTNFPTKGLRSKRRSFFSYISGSCLTQSYRILLSSTTNTGTHCSRFALTSTLLLIPRSNTLSQTIPHVETLHVDGAVKSNVIVIIVRNAMTGVTRVVLTIELPVLVSLLQISLAIVQLSRVVNVLWIKLLSTIPKGVVASLSKDQ